MAARFERGDEKDAIVRFLNGDKWGYVKMVLKDLSV